MSIFRTIVLCSALVGLIVGLAISLAQQFGTVPLILEGEIYEKAAAAEANAIPAVLSHEMMRHKHSEEAWEPADAFERNASTVVVNILTASGYALVLIGLFALRGKPIGWREGLLWGLGSFIVVTAAPSLGISPELPGVPAASLLARQLWWIGTVGATGGGLALLVFQRSPWAAAAAIVLIALPHLVGAPQLAEVQTNVPEALSHQFVVAVTLTSLLFWALLGSLSGALYRRFILRPDQPSLPRRGTG